MANDDAGQGAPRPKGIPDLIKDSPSLTLEQVFSSIVLKPNPQFNDPFDRVLSCRDFAHHPRWPLPSVLPVIQGQPWMPPDPYDITPECKEALRTWGRQPGRPDHSNRHYRCFRAVEYLFLQFVASVFRGLALNELKTPVCIMGVEEPKTLDLRKAPAPAEWFEKFVRLNFASGALFEGDPEHPAASWPPAADGPITWRLRLSDIVVTSRQHLEAAASDTPKQIEAPASAVDARRTASEQNDPEATASEGKPDKAPAPLAMTQPTTSRREARKAETRAWYEVWHAVSQRIKKDGKKRRPGELARAVARDPEIREKAKELGRDVPDGNTIKRRLNEFFPGWAK